MNRAERRILKTLKPIDPELWLSRIERHPAFDANDLQAASQLIGYDTVYQSLSVEPAQMEATTEKLLDHKFAAVYASGYTALGEGFDLIFRLPESLEAGRR